MRKITFKEWEEEGQRLFGSDKKKWLYKCPSCGNTQSFEELVATGMSAEDASKRFYYSCIGRWDNKQGCDYTNGGLINIADTVVILQDGNEVSVFDFAEAPNKVKNKKFL